MFIDWYLPGYKAGGPIRSCANIVQHLSDEFEFKIVTRDTDYTETKPYPGIRSNEWNTLDDGTSVYYFSEEQLTRKNIRQLISGTEFDAVYLNGVYSVYFTLYPLVFLRKKHEKLIVLAVRGMLAESAVQIKKNKKRLFLKAVKLLGLFNRVVFHASTKAEQKDIEKQLGQKYRIEIAGNLSAKEIPALNPAREKKSGSLSLVSVARIAPEKNLVYALEALLKVKGIQVKFDIYGPIYNEEYWTACRKLIETMPPNIVVTMHGSIPQKSVQDLWQNYHFLFMPTTGENFGHIILQALAGGCPVIISDRTPWKDLEAKGAGWDIPLSAGEQFVKVILECAAMDQETFSSMSNKAFRFADAFLRNPERIAENRNLFRL